MGRRTASTIPWGDNVEYEWTPPAGTTVTYTDGTTANSPRPAFTVPATGEDVTHVFRLTATGRGGVAATSSVDVRVAAGPRVELVEFVGTPRRVSGGRTVYAQSEFIEVALRFDRAVSVDIAGGTPSMALTIGTAQKTAEYRRGTGMRQLVFGYRVASGDSDGDGVDLVANSLALNGGTIVDGSDNAAAALGHAALAGGANRGVDGSMFPQGLGICGRSPAVQAAILERIPSVTRCTQVSGTQLRAITGTLDVSAQVSAHGRMTALKVGDFDALAGVTTLDLDNHAIRVFPAGIFGPLTALTELSIAYNQTQAADRLRSLPAGLFTGLTNLTTLRLEHNDLERLPDGIFGALTGLTALHLHSNNLSSLPAGIFGALTGLTALHLHDNNLSSLPDGIFGELTNLTTLTLSGNPGTATFLPVAVAGPEGGIDAVAGKTVTLGGDAGGPWGNNLIYSWRKATGTTVDLSARNIQEPTFPAPALAEASELGYELTVTARGTSLTATDSVTVRVATATVVSRPIAFVSEPVSGDTYKQGESIEAAVTFSKPVTVTGTPTLALSVGTNTRQATYDRGTGTNRLVFAYTVESTDTDSDGIAIDANSLGLPTEATIVDTGGGKAVLTHTALAAQAGHKVDGSDEALTGGICERTPQIRDKLLELVKANDSNVTNCSLVDPDNPNHLAALTGTLNLDGSVPGNRMTGLKAGDFAGLTGITNLALTNHWLRDIPAGVFDPLTALTVLNLSGNGTSADDGLTRLPAGLFDRLTGLTNTPAAQQRPLVAAAADLREADQSHEPVAGRQPRQRALRADRKGRAGGRVRGRLGRQRHPRGRWGGERLRRSLGRQRRV